MLLSTVQLTYFSPLYPSWSADASSRFKDLQPRIYEDIKYFWKFVKQIFTEIRHVTFDTPVRISFALMCVNLQQFADESIRPNPRRSASAGSPFNMFYWRTYRVSVRINTDESLRGWIFAEVRVYARAQIEKMAEIENLIRGGKSVFMAYYWKFWRT